MYAGAGWLVLAFRDRLCLACGAAGRRCRRRCRQRWRRGGKALAAAVLLARLRQFLRDLPVLAFARLRGQIRAR